MESKSMIKLILGSIAFLLGISLLGFVFYLGYNLFLTDTYPVTNNLKENETTKQLTHWGFTIGIKSIMLIFMTVAASLISNMGISILFDKNINYITHKTEKDTNKN